MKKIIKKLLFMFIFMVFVIKPVFADEAKNNKFGIHLAQPHLEDLVKAKLLLNSTGGDWGYVTLVMQENDRNKDKWQEIFDKMREYHLISLVRIATQPEGNSWRRPTKEDADSWVEFLDSLNWVVKNRYVILFNEPNHATEWGSSVDAKNYADTMLLFAQKLKQKNPDFFVMLAGLDASAPQALPSYQDESSFLQQVFNSETIQQWNTVLSGLASHSYPNPGFSGIPYGFGRGTVRTYQWELDLLKQLGIKDMPVFITETGWVRGDESQVADNYKIAFENVWLPDGRVVAVTPFVFDYQGDPFLSFSWKLPSIQASETHEFYQQFYTVQGITKEKGNPAQVEKGDILVDLPSELVAHSNFHFSLKLKNTGQALWDKQSGYQLSIISSQGPPFEYFFSEVRRIQPFKEEELDMYVKTNGTLGKRKATIALMKNEETILSSKEWAFEIFPLPQLHFSVNLFPHLKSNGDGFEIQVFNNKEEIVFKKKGVAVRDGNGKVEEIRNVALGSRYRIVLLKAGYLPRQTFVAFHKGQNNITFEIMFPFDLNHDGKLDISDLFFFAKK